MTRPTPRRPASSRGGTQRPRKLAGQSPLPRQPEGSSPDAPEPATDAPEQAPEVAEERVGFLARPKTTRILIVVLSVLALFLAAQCAWWLLRGDADDTRPAAGDEAGLVVPQGRPVVAAQLAVLDGVEAAAKAAQEIVAVDHASYDEEVDRAAELMTAEFEEQYRATAEDIKQEFVAQKTVVQVNVVAQGVVRANRTELEALIFLNQVVNRVRDGKPETVVTPFKVLVAMVHTDQGWLVDGLETDDPGQDSNN